MMSLSSPVSLPLLSDALAAGWRWWTKELLSLIPDRYRHRLLPEPPEIILDIGLKSITATAYQADKPSRTLVERSDGDVPAALADLRESAFHAGAETIIRLAPELT